MEITNSKIYVLYNTIEKIKQGNPSISVKTGYFLIKNYNLLKTYYDSIEEMKLNIIKPNIESSDEFGNVKIFNDKIEKVNEELIELGNIVVEIPELAKISIDEIEHLQLSFEEIESLIPILRD